jgi:hypothetical protein
MMIVVLSNLPHEDLEGPTLTSYAQAAPDTHFCVMSTRLRSAAEIAEAIVSSRADVVIAWKPAKQHHAEELEELSLALAERTVLYVDGDAYGGRSKPLPAQTKWWLRKSRHVFTSAAGPHIRLLVPHTRGDVHYLPYCAPARWLEASATPANQGDGITFIGSSTARFLKRTSFRIPGTGLSGESGRTEMVRRLRRSGPKFELWGSGWPRGWSTGVLPFERQLEVITRAQVSVGWDHYPEYDSYFSDRLPIALMSGRPHVSSLHPGEQWMSDIPGLSLCDTPEGVVETAVQETRRPFDIGLARDQREWVRHNLTTDEAARYILSKTGLCEEPDGVVWSAAKRKSHIRDR